MNILTHPVHTGYQFDLAKTGNEFYSISLSGDGALFWDEHSRPKPKNYHALRSLDESPVKFDLILVHSDLGFERLKQIDLPLIFKEHCIRHPFQVPQAWIDRVNYFSFASQTAAQAWRMPYLVSNKKVIIGMGVDTELYKGYTGNGRGVLAVGNSIPRRGQTKGAEDLTKLALAMDIDVVGGDNRGIRGAVGACQSHSDLIRHYQTHKVLFNPSRLLTMSTLEAMATGMPVVSFKIANSDIIKNGINGILVESVSEAVAAIQRLLADEQFRLQMGTMARRTIQQRYALEKFVQRWNCLFRLALGDREHHRALWDNWRIRLPINMATKTNREVLAAKRLIGCKYDFWQIGQDHREMSFQGDGKIGCGATCAEVFWEVRDAHGVIELEICSREDLTCRLKLQPNGSWAGTRVNREAMPVILSPLHINTCSSQHSEIGVGARLNLATKHPKVVALIAFRNEEDYLKGFFNHLDEFVDGFIALDDCSTDSSADIARAQPKLLILMERHLTSADHYYETHNREALLRTAHFFGADWVLCCDADERYETRFLQDLRTVVKDRLPPVKALHLRPLWNSLRKYRVGNAHKCVLFPATDFGTYHAPHGLHGQWQPPALNNPRSKVVLDYNLYHLGSLTRTLRIARHQKFETIDPLHKAQPEGYEGLVDELNVITAPISLERGFKL